MKKILVGILLILSTAVSFGETRDNYAFFGNFFGKNKDKEKENKNTNVSVEIPQNDTGREIPEFLEFTYIPKETEGQPMPPVNEKGEAEFKVQVLPVQAGDNRPPEIVALEKAITNERVREKITPMMKYYEKFFREYLNEISNDSEKIYQLGNQYFMNRQYERARDIFSKNIDSVDNLFGAAVTNRFLGYDSTAIDYYSEIIYTEPNLAEAYLGRGICYRNLGQYKEALADFLKYKSMKNTEEAYTSLGNVYILREEYEKAKQILTEGRVIYPNSKLINDLLVRAYAK